MSPGLRGADRRRARRQACEPSAAALQHEHGETAIVLSSITVIELEHGLHRARTAEQTRARRDYLDTVFAAIPVEPFTREMAQLAAKIDADARQIGRTIPFSDLLIGVTALHFGYAVGTRNPRHFRMVPNLAVIQLCAPPCAPFLLTDDCPACRLHSGKKGPNIELWGYSTPPLARGAYEQ
ncbi:MAG: PIN domain-containing protein [Candidatus Solibacter sp.]|nr:PIN domain-containing protein [Candidatus Solibacter sp.]